MFMWSPLWHVLAGIVLTEAFQAAIPDYQGNEFVLAFMQNDRHGPLHVQQNPELYITTKSPNVVKVNVTFPLMKDIMADTFLEVTRNKVTQVTLPPESKTSGMQIEKKALRVMGEEEIIVYGMNKQAGSSDSFLGLPTDVLGQRYFIASYWEKEKPSKSEFVVVAKENDTAVLITLPKARNNSSPYFEYKGVTYFAGDHFNVTLQAYETFQVQSESQDLTGVKVEANTSVAVFSGSEKTVIEGVTRDHLVEHLPPLRSWGRSFMTVPIAMRITNVGDVFRVIASSDRTQLLVRYSKTLDDTFWIDEGDFVELRVTSEQYLYIVTNYPVLVMQFAKSQDSGSYETDPFMITIPPSPQYENLYTFTTVKPGGIERSFTNYVNLVVEESKKDGLMMDSKELPELNWTAIAGTKYVGAQLPIEEGAHMIWHNLPNVGFSAVMYGHSQFESYGYPAGMRMAELGLFCNVSSTRAGDGLDNDCDDRIDEELPNGIDDDGDGKVDEDLAQTVDWKAVLKDTLPPVVSISISPSMSSSDADESISESESATDYSESASDSESAYADSATTDVLEASSIGTSVLLPRDFQSTTSDSGKGFISVDSVSSVLSKLPTYRVTFTKSLSPKEPVSSPTETSTTTSPDVASLSSSALSLKLTMTETLQLMTSSHFMFTSSSSILTNSISTPRNDFLSTPFSTSKISSSAINHSVPSTTIRLPKPTSSFRSSGGFLSMTPSILHSSTLSATKLLSSLPPNTVTSSQHPFPYQSSEVFASQFSTHKSPEVVDEYAVLTLSVSESAELMESPCSFVTKTVGLMSLCVNSFQDMSIFPSDDYNWSLGLSSTLILTEETPLSTIPAHDYNATSPLIQIQPTPTEGTDVKKKQEEKRHNNLPSTIAIMVVAVSSIPVALLLFLCLRSTNCKIFSFCNRRQRVITSAPTQLLPIDKYKKDDHKTPSIKFCKAKKFLAYSNSKEIFSEIPVFVCSPKVSNKGCGNVIALNEIPPTPPKSRWLSRYSDVSDISQASCVTMTNNASSCQETLFMTDAGKTCRANPNFLGSSLHDSSRRSTSQRGSPSKEGLGGGFTKSGDSIRHSSRGSSDDESQYHESLTTTRTTPRSSIASISVVRINLRDERFHDDEQ